MSWPWWSSPFPGSVRLELEAVGERARVVLELGDELLRHREEHVVAEEARDSDQEARDRRQERGRDAGGERLDARRLLDGDGAEGVHDAPDGPEEPEERGARDDGRQEDHVALVAQRLPGEGALESVLRVLEAEPKRVHALLLADRGRAPVRLDGVAEEVRIGDVPALAQGLGQLEELLLVPQVPLEGGVQAPQRLQLVALPEHDGPRDYAEYGEAARDHLAHDVAVLKDIDNVGRGEDGGEGDGHGPNVGGFWGFVHWISKLTRQRAPKSPTSPHPWSSSQNTRANSSRSRDPRAARCARRRSCCSSRRPGRSSCARSSPPPS